MILTLGNEFVFASGSTEVPVVRALSDDKFIVAWKDASDSGKGKIRIGTRNGTDIDYGPVSIFCESAIQSGTTNTYARQGYEISVIDENTIFAIYTPSDQYAYAVVCQISGDIVTSGAQYRWTGISSDTEGVTCTPTTVKTGNKIFCAQIHDTDYILSAIATITDMSISFGTLDTVDDNYTLSNIRATKIDNDRAMVTYGWNRVVVSSKYKAIVYNLYATTVSPGNIAELYEDSVSSAATQENEPGLLFTYGTSEAIVSYAYKATDRVAYISIGGIGGIVVTVENEAQRLTGDPRLGAILTKNADEFDIVYVDPNDSNYGKITHGTITGGAPSYDSSEVWHSGSTVDHHACVLDYPVSVIAYRDTDNSNYGTARIVWLTGLTIASADLFVQGRTNYNVSGSLYTEGHENVVASGNLVIRGLQSINDSCDLYVVDGCVGFCDQTYLFIDAHRTTSTSGNLYTIGNITHTTSDNLFVHGSINESDNSDLFIVGHESNIANLSIFIHGHDPTGGGLVDLFIDGYKSAPESGNLFIHGHTVLELSHDLFIHGHNNTIVSEDLFIGGSGIIPWSGQTNLCINGFIPIIPTTCPILDPTASIQIKDTLIRIYQSRIDALINQLGKNVYLEFDPIRDPCPNCEYDTMRKRSTGIYITGGPRPFTRGRKCPYCKGRGFTETAVNKCIKCLIKWNPDDAKDFGISITQTKGIVRLKTYLTEADDLSRAKTIITNHDIVGQMKLKVRLIRGPIPVGLREDRYCISFWELI